MRVGVAREDILKEVELGLHVEGKVELGQACSVYQKTQNYSQMPHGEIKAQCIFYSNLSRREEKP